MVQTGGSGGSSLTSDQIATQLAAIAAKLDTILSRLRGDVAEIKSPMIRDGNYCETAYKDRKNMGAKDSLMGDKGGEMVNSYSQKNHHQILEIKSDEPNAISLTLESESKVGHAKPNRKPIATLAFKLTTFKVPSTIVPNIITSCISAPHILPDFGTKHHPKTDFQTLTLEVAGKEDQIVEKGDEPINHHEGILEISLHALFCETNTTMKFQGTLNNMEIGSGSFPIQANWKVMFMVFSINGQTHKLQMTAAGTMVLVTFQQLMTAHLPPNAWLPNSTPLVVSSFKVFDPGLQEPPLSLSFRLDLGTSRFCGREVLIRTHHTRRVGSKSKLFIGPSQSHL